MHGERRPPNRDGQPVGLLLNLEPQPLWLGAWHRLVRHFCVEVVLARKLPKRGWAELDVLRLASRTDANRSDDKLTAALAARHMKAHAAAFAVEADHALRERGV